MPHNHMHTQPVVQLQHKRAVSTRITPPDFIPRGNAEVDHVTVRWHLNAFSHHALLMWCMALRHWGKFSVTTNFPYLWQQSRTVAKQPQPKGPTLGWLFPVMKIPPARDPTVCDLSVVVRVAPFELSEETRWKRLDRSHLELLLCAAKKKKLWKLWDQKKNV